MTKLKTLLLPSLFLLAALACNVEVPVKEPFIDPDQVETFAALPFYGELNFLVLAEGSETPISGTSLKVENLPLDGLDENGAAFSDEAGYIILQQTHRGTAYYGDGPDEPVFTFISPGYETAVFTMTELAEATGYDPYDTSIAVFEFTIFLFTTADSTTFDDRGMGPGSVEEGLDLLLVAASAG